MRLAGAGKYKDAESRFTTAIGIAPHLANGFLERGLARQNLGEQDQALEDFEHALSLNRNLAAAHTAAGSIYRDRGDLNRAMEEFNAGIRAGASVDAIYQRGQTYESMGEYRKAVDDYNAAILELTDAPYVYNARALAREKLGDTRGAQEDRQKAFALQHPIRRPLAEAAVR